MAPESPEKQGETDNPFACLSPYEFVLLITSRKSGVGVPTAMWFAHGQGKLYMVTARTTINVQIRLKSFHLNCARAILRAESAYLFGPLQSRTAYFKLFAEQGT